MSDVTGRVDVSAVWPDVFSTERLCATPVSEVDGALFAALYGDAETMAHIGAPLDVDAAARGLSGALRQMRSDPPKARYWRLDEDGHAAGLLSLVVDPDRHTAETGVLLGDGARGRGIAREALAALLPRVVCAGGLDAVWTRHRPGHAAADGLMRALGFAPLGTADGWARWQMDRRRLQALAETPVTV
ncbi:GNAT family N-acetyltransferase [Luteimonas sp. 3794]|uniref:GNAT family N-acetyltransferase n=1 Tax=Luteimonas sp. 3794 TaxID=2817730 RepID=UPI002854D101|nr:GNAT family N-acetyltransferase [Luteimonas sp. 3794]MDR6992527.1 RimJ/RimL family protein N-acetyltransferase [Luteimonas sp. 3794]